MLMNNNASLNERVNLEISAGSAVFILDTLSGREYSIEEVNGKKYIIWNKFEKEIGGEGRVGRLGGRQSFDGFLQSIEGNNLNMEAAMDFRINRLREKNPLLEKFSNFDIVSFFYANASESDRNYCVETANALGNDTLNSTVASVVKEAFEKYKVETTASMR